MADFLYDSKYDLCRRHIELARQNGMGWEELNTLGMLADELDRWFVLQQKTSFWPSLGETPEDRLKKWQDLVSGKRVADEALISATRPLVVVGLEESEPGIVVPQESKSAWQLYKESLLKQNWKDAAVDGIEVSALKILRHLRKKTLGRSPVKGLVVGHVQSGKTASMAGLIAMAADHGWNIFIVLSGTLENLRLQTKNRLFKDLNHLGNLDWQVEDQPSRNSAIGHRAQDMHFQEGSRKRHLIVSLKNASRLAALIEWLKAGSSNMKHMRVLVIDDEADQAGINTADVSSSERTTINRLIIALTRIPALSVNYVAYTATPAANFLNESPGEKSLYPDDFIVSLPQSDEHFGPLQIFGAPEDGYKPLGIIRQIEQVELSKISKLHENFNSELPESLKESVIWFLCSVAAMRTNKFCKPVSMLIHTSQRQVHHENVGKAIQLYLEKAFSNWDEFVSSCEKIWNEVAKDLNTENFAERFPLYGRLAEISEYPEFSKIQQNLHALLAEISAIRLDQDNEMTYHEGIHLCIDNCANNGISDENEIRRLFYPTAEPNKTLKFAAAFIVIGGSTLARGLTLENLVSTYFLRASKQADSLMQMGRWFGYRKGYELLPRIWMPSDTLQKFKFITLAEEDLREDLKRFMYAGAKPADFGPRVKVSPRASWLRPTAKNRMQQGVACGYDFSGVNRQTTIFDDGENASEKHKTNIELTEKFISSLEPPFSSERGTALVWKNVSFKTIAQYLEQFNFHTSAQFFSEIKAFIAWYHEHEESLGYTAWNIVVAGSRPESNNVWKLAGSEVGRVNRSRLLEGSSDGAVSVGVLRDPRDLLADAELNEVPPKLLTNELISTWRIKGNVGQTPQLLIYLIDKNSDAKDQVKKRDKKERGALAAKEHIVGLSIWLPKTDSSTKSFVAYVTVHIPLDISGVDDDLNDTADKVLN